MAKPKLIRNLSYTVELPATSDPKCLVEVGKIVREGRNALRFYPRIDRSEPMWLDAADLRMILSLIKKVANGSATKDRK